MKKHLYAIGCMANTFECYEFSVYSYLAGIIATQFFAAGDLYSNLIKVFLIFAVSYLIKPLGGLVWGYIGDHYGKAFVMRWSLIIMAIPSFLIGLLPNYEQIGVLSTALLLLLRLIQGFAVAGELPGSACYLHEASKPRDQRFHCSFVLASSMLGMLLGSGLVTALHSLLSDAQMQSFGWRIPFFLGLPMALVIYQFRKNIVSTGNIQQSTRYFRELFRDHWKKLLAGIGINAFSYASFYLLFSWMPTYLIYYLHKPEQQAHNTITIGLLALICLTLAVGKCSSRVNRNYILGAGILLLASTSYPLFQLLSKADAPLLLIQLCFAFNLSLINGVFLEILVSQFKPAVRCIGTSLSFTVSMALFASFAPSLASLLIEKSGNLLAPALMISSVGIIALIAVLFVD